MNLFDFALKEYQMIDAKANTYFSYLYLIMALPFAFFRQQFFLYLKILSFPFQIHLTIILLSLWFYIYSLLLHMCSAFSLPIIPLQFIKQDYI